MGRLLIEKYIQAVRMSGFNTNKDAYFGGNVTVVGTLTAGQEVIGAETITSTSANAFAVGRQGATAPVLNIDASTASVATGINIKGAAAAAGVAVSVISSGTNENLTIDAKGSGTLKLQSAAGVFAGGAAQCSVLVSTNSGFGIYWGSGAPTVSAGKGSIYLRSDGSTTNDRMYVNTNGSTTWTAVTTVA